MTFADPKIRAVSAPPGPISDQTGVTPGTSPVTMAGANVNGAQQNGTPGETEKKAPPKFQRQKSFTVTTVYTPPSNPSKAIQKIRAKTRVAKAFKNTLSVGRTFVDLRYLTDDQTRSQLNLKTHLRCFMGVNRDHSDVNKHRTIL